MKITLVSDPWIPVPPLHYGGIERVVADLGRELSRRGHEVTLYAGPNSHSPGRLVVFGRTTFVSIAGRLSSTRPVWDGSCDGRWEKPMWFTILDAGLSLHGPAVPDGQVNTYMRRVHAPNIQATGALGARQLIYTAVSDHIRHGGEMGGGLADRLQWDRC